MPTFPLSNLQDWGAIKDGLKNVHIQDFLSSVDRFVCSLSSARQNMEGKFQLNEVDSAPSLSNLQEPADYTAAGRGFLTTS